MEDMDCLMSKFSLLYVLNCFFFQNPGTELEESYLKFVKLNLERFRTHLNDEKMKKQLIKVQSCSQR